LGNLLEGGEEIPGLRYDVDLDSLTRHIFITGITGSGKSNTCRRIISELMERGKNFLVIEPAKDEYVQLALAYNQAGTFDRKIAVYMPATLVAAHTVVNGVTLKAASYDADVTGLASNTGDIRPLGTSLVGDYHTAHADTLVGIKDIKGFGINTDVAGNNVNVVVGNYDTSALSGLDFADIVVTRKLAAVKTQYYYQRLSFQ
jgi:hypothetical protein